jgi:hypothetical protein
MCTFALPTHLVSDHGSALTSRTFKIFCETYAIRHVLNAVVTPRSSRQCERYNKAIVTMLATTSVESEIRVVWDTHVKKLQSASTNVLIVLQLNLS